jgi:hypothetical protein
MWSSLKNPTTSITADVRIRAFSTNEGRRLSDDLHLSQLRKARGADPGDDGRLARREPGRSVEDGAPSGALRRTLRKFIEAMNGELVLAARFSDSVEIPIQLAEAEDAA